MLGCQTRSVPATKNEVAVSRIGKPEADEIAEQRGAELTDFLIAGRKIGWLSILDLIAHAALPSR